MNYSAALLISALLIGCVLAVPQNSDRSNSRSSGIVSAPRLLQLEGKESLLPIGTPATGNRTGRFFGLTTGAGTDKSLQLGLSFIVPFLSIPTGGAANIFGNNYGTSTYGTAGTTSTSLFGINTSTIIVAVAIGIGAIILIPYLIYLTTGASTSAYGRSDDIQEMLNGLIVKVDDALLQYDIDATACLQRAVCTYVKTSTKRMVDGSAGSVEKIIDGLATNDYVNSIFDGTRVQQAMQQARKAGAPCAQYFQKCPHNMANLYRTLSQYANLYGQVYAATHSASDKSSNNAAH